MSGKYYASEKVARYLDWINIFIRFKYVYNNKKAYILYQPVEVAQQLQLPLLQPYRRFSSASQYFSSSLHFASYCVGTTEQGKT